MQTLNEQDFLARRREAAAITCVLDIDDSGYRGARFYPADLVAFCRMNGIAPGATAATQDTHQQRLDET
ncbi:hypothetical protein [Janthinobacterium svalbardensis]|uniref:hypothetical protein n=1 Tax=Janthinobacterium svalbardensis TaxID=368607 RepID=UPI002FCDD26F